MQREKKWLQTSLNANQEVKSNVQVCHAVLLIGFELLTLPYNYQTSSVFVHRSRSLFIISGNTNSFSSTLHQVWLIVVFKQTYSVMQVTEPCHWVVFVRDLTAAYCTSWHMNSSTTCVTVSVCYYYIYRTVSRCTLTLIGNIPIKILVFSTEQRNCSSKFCD